MESASIRSVVQLFLAVLLAGQAFASRLDFTLRQHAHHQHYRIFASHVWVGILDGRSVAYSPGLSGLFCCPPGDFR